MSGSSSFPPKYLEMTPVKFDAHNDLDRGSRGEGFTSCVSLQLGIRFISMCYLEDQSWISRVGGIISLCLSRGDSDVPWCIRLVWRFRGASSIAII